MDKWRAIDMHKRGGVTRWLVEHPQFPNVHSNAHCACCAYTDALTQYGGDVDLRGLQSYGICYQFLAVVVKGIRHPSVEDEEPPQ